MREPLEDPVDVFVAEDRGDNDMGARLGDSLEEPVGRVGRFELVATCGPTLGAAWAANGPTVTCTAWPSADVQVPSNW